MGERDVHLSEMPHDPLDAFLDDLRSAAADTPTPAVGDELAVLFRDGAAPVVSPAPAPRPRRWSVRAAVAGAVAGLTFGGLGIAGALPGPVQRGVADVARQVGVELPDDEPTPTTVTVPDHPTRVAPTPTTAPARSDDAPGRSDDRRQDDDRGRGDDRQSSGGSDDAPNPSTSDDHGEDEDSSNRGSGSGEDSGSSDDDETEESSHAGSGGGSQAADRDTDTEGRSQ
jgi:hypothetical protein